MNCAEIIPKLELMADDELTSEQAAQILSHIDDCSSCRDNWYGILALRQAIKDRATSFNPANDFEERLINAVSREAWQSRAGQGKNSWVLYAACLIAAGACGSYLYSVSREKKGRLEHVVVAAKSAMPDTCSQPVPAKTPSPSYTAVSLEDALSNFKQYLEKPARSEGAPISPGNLSTLSSQAGFAVKPMQLSGFKLSGAELVAAAPGKTTMVRLCYTRIKGTGKGRGKGNWNGNVNGHDSVICYQAACGHLVAKGLNEHLIDGKKICCGEVGDKSVVFIPGQKDNTNEVLLVGTISKSDLMDLVLSSS